MLTSFPYFGSKRRSVDALLALAGPYDVWIEPFGGSLACAINAGMPWRAAEAHPRVRAMVEWFQTTTPAEIQDVRDHVRERLAACGGSVDVRDLQVPHEGARWWVRVGGATLRGVVHGFQATAVPSDRIVASLEAFRRGRIVGSNAYAVDWSAVVADAWAPGTDGRAVFLVDPPYGGTDASYACDVDTAAIRYLVEYLSTLGRVVFTYGNDAAEAFPGMPWRTLLVRNQRNGVSGQGAGVSEGKAQRADMVAVLGS